MNSTFHKRMNANGWQPIFGSDIAACILAKVSNQPMTLDNIVQLATQQGWKSQAKSPRHSMLAALKGYSSKDLKSVFEPLGYNKFRLREEFYKSHGDKLAKLITTSYVRTGQLPLPDNTLISLVAKPISVPIPKIEVEKIPTTQQAKEPDWDRLSEADQIERLIKAGIPKDIVGFVYCAVRDETMTFFLSGISQEKMVNKFVAFLFALDDVRLINWVCAFKPINKLNKNKYEQTIDILIHNAQPHLIKHELQMQQTNAVNSFNVMLKKHEEFTKLREGEVVRLVLMGDVKIIQFATAVYRNGEVLLKY